jgi:hypothetical protein
LAEKDGCVFRHFNIPFIQKIEERLFKIVFTNEAGQHAYNRRSFLVRDNVEYLCDFGRVVYHYTYGMAGF